MIPRLNSKRKKNRLLEKTKYKYVSKPKKMGKIQVNCLLKVKRINKNLSLAKDFKKWSVKIQVINKEQ